MLDALARTLTAHQLETLVAKLNANNRRALAHEWEVVVLFGLKDFGRVIHEAHLGGPSKADIFLQLEDDPNVQFAADITCISDRGLEDANPIGELMELIREKAQKLGIRSGFDHRVRHKISKAKVRLRMPEKKQLHQFFQTRIVPHLIAIARTPAMRWSLDLRDDLHDIQIFYHPGKRYSTANYPAFRHATVIDSNPLYNRLEDKRKQLRDSGYDGPTGIIVCDGGCETLTRKAASWDSFSKAQIVDKFLKSNPSVSFVLLLWIDDPLSQPGAERVREARSELYLNPKAEKAVSPRLHHILRQITRRWPSPIQNGENARHELEGIGYKKAQPFWGHSFGGGHTMGTGPNILTFRMSARNLVEILAGQMTHADFAAAHGFAPTGQSPGVNPLALALARGLTVSSVTLERVPYKDDDWIEFRLTGPDPAIAPFRTPKAPSANSAPA